MEGVVEVINPKLAFVGARTQEGYSILEVLGGDVELGDRLSWSGSTPLGGEIVHNLTSGHDLDVYFQNHHVSKAGLRAQMRL